MVRNNIKDNGMSKSFAHILTEFAQHVRMICISHVFVGCTATERARGQNVRRKNWIIRTRNKSVSGWSRLRKAVSATVLVAKPISQFYYVIIPIYDNFRN